MLPNERFLKHFPDAQLSPSDPPSKRSGTLRAGTYLAFAAIIKEYGLDKLLEASFGDKAGFILDLASYLIVSEDNAGQYYPDYARCHPLFTCLLYTSSSGFPLGLRTRWVQCAASAKTVQ